MNKAKKLFLIDAYAIIYRSYYAFINNPRINSKGLNTSAIFGFANSLLEIITKEKPSNIIVVFDPPTRTFRHEIFPEYKAQRLATPEDIKNAIPYIEQFIDTLNIKRLWIANYEADDVVGTLANMAEKEGFVTFMMTPDKDYGQLVTENVLQYKPRRFGEGVEILDPEKICEKFGVDTPDQIRDILALWGDASDNIPGAKGIGEKTAKKLIKEFGSVENLIENAHQLSGKIKENIMQDADTIRLAKVLVTIVKDIPIDINWDDTLLKDYNIDALQQLLNELEFKNMLQRIVGAPIAETKQPVAKKPTAQLSLFDAPVAAPSVENIEEEKTEYFQTIQDFDHEYILVDSNEKIEQLIKELTNAREICFDTETTGLDTINDDLVGISFAVKPHQAYFVILPESRADAEKIIELFRPIFENDAILKIGQNIKFDLMMLAQYGITIKGKMFDTMLAHYLIQPEARHNMDFLAEQYLSYKTIHIDELIGAKGKNQRSIRTANIELLKDYACEDADITLQLKLKLEKELKNNDLETLAYNIEMPLLKVLAKMEMNGVKIDKSALNIYAEVLQKELAGIENEIYELAGGKRFNIASPKQLGDVLFIDLAIDANAKKTKTKQFSTGEEILDKLRDKHSIIDKILEYRSLTKLLSTYIEALPNLINNKTLKVHTSYNQAITSTGRLSSTHPNLQNIPIREDRGREIRKSFIPSDENHLFLAADYSQIELRIMAHFSQDEHMIKAFVNGEDIHTATAAKIYGIQPADVTKDMRRKAKTANFGIIYGISAFGLSERLRIPRGEAKELIDGYFANFPGVKAYMNNAINDARDKGYVSTLTGRKRFLPNINSRNHIVQAMDERNAINAPIQGSAADIIKIAMIAIQNRFENENIQSQMILQVHDELVFDVLTSELETVKNIVKTEMENAIKLLVPIDVDMGVGNNWLEAH